MFTDNFLSHQIRESTRIRTPQLRREFSTAIFILLMPLCRTICLCVQAVTSAIIFCLALSLEHYFEIWKQSIIIGNEIWTLWAAKQVEAQFVQLDHHLHRLVTLYIVLAKQHFLLSFIFYIRKIIGIRKIFHLQFLTNLHSLGCPEHDFTIFPTNSYFELKIKCSQNAATVDPYIEWK